MIQTHRMWAPLHHTTGEGAEEVKTYYIVLDYEELEQYRKSVYNNTQIAEWKQVLTRVYQHYHLFEKPQQAMDYVVSLVAAAMSTATVPENESLRLVALNLYPHVVLQCNLLHTYKRSGSDYLEQENHSDALQNMDTFSTPTVTITGCTYNYSVQMLTPHFFEHHVLDTTTINGDLHTEIGSLRNVLSRGTTMDRATPFIKKVRPDYKYLLDEETTGEATASTTTSKKKGVRSTTIAADYDIEITVKHVKRM